MEKMFTIVFENTIIEGGTMQNKQAIGQESLKPCRLPSDLVGEIDLFDREVLGTKSFYFFLGEMLVVFWIDRYILGRSSDDQFPPWIQVLCKTSNELW